MNLVTGLFKKHQVKRQRSTVEQLSMAVRNNDAKAIRSILDSTEITIAKQSELATRVLHLAAYHGMDQAMEALLHYEPRVNCLNDSGASPLHLACQQGHAETVRQLTYADDIELDLKLETNGSTPLLLAAYYGHIDVLNALLAARANTDPVRVSGHFISPVDVARQQGHKDCVNALNYFNAFGEPISIPFDDDDAQSVNSIIPMPPSP